MNGDLSQSVLDVNLFTVRCYIQHWFLTQVPQAAPRSDVSFIRALIAYRTVNKEVADRALDKVGRHLWYLSEELVPLAFFDNDVSLEVKRQMVKSLTVRYGGTISKKMLTLTLGEGCLVNINVCQRRGERSLKGSKNVKVGYGRPLATKVASSVGD